ncbi:uncharacterized protein [Apostichopus japonicus]|uniref:uncharacterized protein isoform X2 n=1 Tax=Stichopus japonicus TaxID=307972 RepID=UPI003AB62E66
MASAHLEHLRTLCRLCGSTKTIPSDRAPKSKQVYHSWILKALSIDVSLDVAEVHPEFVCQCCTLKLQRWKKKKNKGQNSSVNITLQPYQPHSENCTLCGVAGSTKEHTDLQGYFLKKTIEFGMLSWMNEGHCIVVELNKSGTCIMKRICVNEKGSWEMYVLGAQLSKEDCAHWISPLEELQSEGNVESFLTKVKDIGISEGNGDVFDEAEVNTVKFKNFNVEQYIAKDGKTSMTVRHSQCKLLCNPSTQRCDLCNHYRTALYVKRNRLRGTVGNPTNLTSHVRNDLLSSPQKKLKLKLLERKKDSLCTTISKLEDQIKRIFEVEGIKLDHEKDLFLKGIFMNEEDSMKSKIKPGSPQFLLWEQQKNNLMKPSNRWRWHPEIIKWCVAVHGKSPAAYNLIRQSGFLTLPSLKTINKYIHFCKSGVGFIPEVFQKVSSEIGPTTGDISENVTLILDEMKIKSGLVFSGSSGRLVGFTDTGPIKNMLDYFERRFKGETNSKKLPLASHVLVLMVRSIFGTIKAPIAYFTTCELKGDDLFPIVWRCIRHLELFSIRVRAIIADGASPNRKFFKLHETVTDDGLTYYTQNPFRERERIYFFCDVPHLLKTTRNNWENSGCNSKSRMLRFQGKEIRWSHLLSLQEWDQQLNAQAPGLRFVHKLTYEHMNLTPSLRMRVYLAAQVLSKTVANAIESMGRDEMASTVHFINKLNDWFDCLNVANVTQHIQSKNPNLAPYRSIDDERLKLLEDDFLGFLSEWNTEAQEATDVPRETYAGHQITVKSFVQLTKELLQTPGVKYILSEKCSQDPLEEYFSKQRGCGGRNENPTVEQFGHNALSLMVASSKAISSLRSNCRKRPREEEADCL